MSEMERLADVPMPLHRGDTGGLGWARRYDVWGSVFALEAPEDGLPSFNLGIMEGADVAGELGVIPVGQDAVKLRVIERRSGPLAADCFHVPEGAKLECFR